MVNADHLAGGNWWKGQYRNAPDPSDPRYRRWVSEGWICPARGGCPSPEVLHRHARQDAALAAAEARWAAREAARALYRAQRRQALAAITGGLLIMILVLLIDL